MQIQETELHGLLIIEPRVFADERGFFKETYEKQRYAEAGIAAEFVQDNYSRSTKGTLRGLHFQNPHSQGKLVQVFRGEVFDVAVDLRTHSPTFGRWVGVSLTESNHRQLYVPSGFAHGFYVISDVAEVFYKCTDFYHTEHEQTLLWNDASVGVEWPVDGEPTLSGKDADGIPLADLTCFEQGH
jgi:dTDP-4-dehydrorhamnose 3,5-epimerase